MAAVEEFDSKKWSEEQDAGFLSVDDYWATFGDEESRHHDCEIERMAQERRGSGDPLWRHIRHFGNWHAWKLDPRRLLLVWQRIRRGWNDSDAWSLDHHLARIMAEAGRHYIAQQHFVIHCRPGFAEWVEGMEHYAAGCYCRKGRAAVRALPRIFGALWL